MADTIKDLNINLDEYITKFNEANRLLDVHSGKLKRISDQLQGMNAPPPGFGGAPGGGRQSDPFSASLPFASSADKSLVREYIRTGVRVNKLAEPVFKTALSSVNLLNRGLGFLGLSGAAFAVDKAVQAAALDAKNMRDVLAMRGGAKAAQIAFGPYTRPQETMAKLAAGMAQTSPLFGPLALMGMESEGERKKPTDMQFMDLMTKTFRQIQEGKGHGLDSGTFKATHPWLGQIFDDATLNNMWQMDKKEFALQQQRFIEDQKTLALTQDQQLTLTHLQQAFDHTGAVIETEFDKALVDAAPEITQFAKFLEDGGVTLAHTIDNVVKDFEAIDQWWEQSAIKSWLGKAHEIEGKAAGAIGLGGGFSPDNYDSTNTWNPLLWGKKKGTTTGDVLESIPGAIGNFLMPGAQGAELPFGGGSFTPKAWQGAPPDITGEAGGGLGNTLADVIAGGGISIGASTGGGPGWRVPQAFTSDGAPGGRTSGRYPGRIVPGSEVPSGVKPVPGAGISGTTDVDEAIRKSASTAGMDPAHWKAIASIESSLNPNIKNQFGYQGLYQMGGTEWATYGGGADWRNPEANAMGAARLAAHNAAIFRKAQGRDPTADEIYLMHQQGPGFYTGANIPASHLMGNLPPSLRGLGRVPTKTEFEAGWSQEVERRAGIYGKGAMDQATVSKRPSTINDAPYPPSNKKSPPSGAGLLSMNDMGTFQGAHKSYSIKIDNQAGANYAIQGGMLGAGAGNVGVG